MVEHQKYIPEGWNHNVQKLSEKDLKQAFIQNQILDGYVTRCDSNYNLHIHCEDNVTGIIPRSEVEAINIDEKGMPRPNICMNKVNKFIQFKVKGMDNQNNFILSRKEVCREAMSWIMNELQEGMIVDGIVKSIQPYGAFIEIGGGVVGLLHIEDISVARIKSPSERFEIGQRIKVMIKYIDRNLERVILTYKELLGSWQDNAKLFREGDIVTGIVREKDKNKNGIFIELRPNLVGMAEYNPNVEYGTNVIVNVKKIIPEKKKIKLIII